jgi:hypothetical protein
MNGWWGKIWRGMKIEKRSKRRGTPLGGWAMVKVNGVFMYVEKVVYVAMSSPHVSPPQSLISQLQKTIGREGRIK